MKATVLIEIELRSFENPKFFVKFLGTQNNFRSARLKNPLAYYLWARAKNEVKYNPKRNLEFFSLKKRFFYRLNWDDFLKLLQPPTNFFGLTLSFNQISINSSQGLYDILMDLLSVNGEESFSLRSQ